MWLCFIFLLKNHAKASNGWVDKTVDKCGKSFMIKDSKLTIEDFSEGNLKGIC
jgi:hypothetical protein